MHSVKTDEDITADRLVPLWIPIAIGVFERVIITTLVGWSVPGAASFVGAWIAVKAAGGWSGWSKDTAYGRGMFFVRLLGSALSVGFAVAGGLIIDVYRESWIIYR